MTILMAREFLERLEWDRHLQQEFVRAAPDDVDAVLEFAAQQDYDFDEEDFSVALQTFPKSRLAQKFDQHLRISPDERERSTD